MQKQTYLLTYLLCSPPGTGAHLGGGTGPVPPPKEDGRTPPKLPKLEHVALNSACETGAKMHQNAQICKLNFKHFLGAMSPDPHTGEGRRRPSPDLTPRRSCASRLDSIRGLWPLHRPPNQKSWIHPWAHPPSENSGYVYAREQYAVEKLSHPFRKKLGARPQPHPPHRNPGSATG